MDPAATLEHERPGTGSAPRALGPLLFRLLSADDLAQPPARYSLAGNVAVEIGRGQGFAARRSADTLRVDVRDPFASSRHARLEARDGAWLLRDEGSRNGTLVNGRRLAPGEEVALREGDLIEAGHTFFLFRGSARGIAGDNLEPVPGGADPPTLQPEWQVDLAKAARLACTSHEVLIEGESGAGKEVLARFLHDKSGRTGPLVSVNCGALPESLFEDELFGHVRGAFSGAQGERPGLIRAADGGTLFLDEVGEMPGGLQVKLLRVLEDHSVRPLGAEKEIPVDVRVVAATHRGLESLVAQGAFREDLLARLGLLCLRVPPLRDRREDLGLLIRGVLRSGHTPLERIRFELDALRLVLRYPWPLNVRELRRALLAAVDLAAADAGESVTICPHHLPPAVREPRQAPPGQAAAGERAPARAPPSDAELSTAERQLRDEIVGHLRKANGNVAEVARLMQKGRTQIQRWIARFAIDVAAVRRMKD
jgi:sigma-54 dependent transcriptional regulator, acetoin dehydrogenase operon transcriptional activator AcoR